MEYDLMTKPVYEINSKEKTWKFLHETRADGSPEMECYYANLVNPPHIWRVLNIPKGYSEAKP